jgi:hypothetical protein
VIWVQVGDERVTAVPPSGKADVYADFTFAGEPLPEGAQVKFLVGKGKLPEEFDENSRTVKDIKEEDVVGSISAIDGIELDSAVGIVENRLVKNSDDAFEIVPVAKVTLLITKPITEDAITVAAYSTYDKLGTVERLKAESVELTVTEGEGVFLTSGEKYDPLGNTWDEMAPMSVGRAGLTCSSIGSKVYAIGGFNSDFTGATEEYDASLDSWATKASMPVPRGFSSSVAYGGEVYVVGGYSFSPSGGLTSFHKYDPVLDAWTELPSLPIPVAFSTAQVVGSTIYVLFGGSTFTGKDDPSGEKVTRFNTVVLAYDIVGASWSFVDALRGGSVPAANTASPATAVSAGSFLITVPTSSVFPPYGVVTISEGLNSETVAYNRFNGASGAIELAAPLANSYTTSAVVRDASLPETRISPNSHVDGTVIRIYNGKSYLGYNSNATAFISDTVVEFDTATGTFDQAAFSPTLARYRAGSALVGTDAYVAGGSGDKSSWLDEAEYVAASGSVFVGKPTVAEMNLARHSIGCASALGFLFVIGGASSGHAAGWLKIDVKADPKDVRADGKQTASVSITAVDASGDPPPDGTVFRVTGLIFMKLTDKEKEQQASDISSQEGGATQSESGATPAEQSPPPQKISILPVLFSSLEMTMADGKAATTLLERSEDPITEVEQLFNFVKDGEAVVDQQNLKAKIDEQSKRNLTTRVGERRPLYDAAIEVTCEDPFFFGTSSTDAAIAEVASRDISEGQGFSFNPPPAQQGLSATVSFYSDISSIPDVQVVTEEADAADAKSTLSSIQEEIPFGSSPHFDALSTGVRARNVGGSETDLLISASDNDQNSSSNSAEDVVEEANSVHGDGRFPIFVNSFVVTDPVSLSARKARTDVADLELISSDTGGNSFSVIDPSYVGFVIDRIKTSAPASLGAGTITATREISGALRSVTYAVSNLGPSGNAAEMTLWHSVDGYNYEQVDLAFPPNVQTVLPEPIRTEFVRYEVRLSTKTFDSPVLESVELEYVEPNVQYVFAYPQTVAGQLSELASVVNHRLPEGSRVEVGVVHGDSTMFDRDYVSKAQPATGERGTIVAINRDDGGTFIGDEPTRDRLFTDDFVVYRSKTGPWAQDATPTVFVNDQAALPTEYIAVPEQGVVAFRRRLAPEDVVGLEIQNSQSSFRVGIKVVNPTLDAGTVDSFAYMWASTQDAGGGRLNRAPRAVNLFITPSPVLPGGPITANYTFVDPDGDDEDKEETEINWFRNGVVVPGLKNKKSFTNSDIVASRSDGKGLIVKGQEWFFSVRPSDGRAFGPVSVSHTVTVANVPPRASDVTIKTSNKDSTKFTSSDTLTAEFAFADGDSDPAKGTVYSWFKNGNEVKTGDSSSLSPDEQDSSNAKILSPGAVITVQVTPSDGTEFGETVTSDPVTIEGTPPSVADVSLLPTAPTAASNLKITYKFTDKDKLTDQSRVAWFRNDVRVSELDDAKSVPSSSLAPGQKWQAIVTPSNGAADGTAVKSNAVLVKF